MKNSIKSGIYVLIVSLFSSCNFVESITYSTLGFELLKEFHEIQKTLDDTKQILERTNTNFLKEIEKNFYEKQNVDIRGKEAYDKAIKIKRIADDGIKYFDDLKYALISQAGGRKNGASDEELLEASNINLHVNVFKKNGMLIQTKNKLTSIKSEISSISLIELNYNNSYRKIEQYANLPWGVEMVDNKPLVAVIVEFSKIQIDILNCQLLILKEIKQSINNN